MDSLARLEQQIAVFQKAHSGSQVWIAAKNLDTGSYFGLGAREKVRTASTIKLPIMCAVYQLANQGKLRMDEQLVLRDQDKISGSGIIREFGDGTRLTVRDLVHVMIVVSDNTATNLLLDRISADYVNECLDEWGYPDTRSMRKVRGDRNQLKAAAGHSKAGRLPENQRFGLGSSTPHDMIAILEKLERGEIVSGEASREMIAILARQQLKEGIGRRVNARLRVASKSGALDALRADVGIVYGPNGRIAIAITVDNMPKIDYSFDNAGNILIADLTDTLLTMLARSR